MSHFIRIILLAKNYIEPSPAVDEANLKASCFSGGAHLLQLLLYKTALSLIVHFVGCTLNYDIEQLFTRAKLHTPGFDIQ